MKTVGEAAWLQLATARLNEGWARLDSTCRTRSREGRSSKPGSYVYLRQRIESFPSVSGSHPETTPTTWLHDVTLLSDGVDAERDGQARRE